MSKKRQEKTISPFNVVLNWLVCLQPDWIPHGMSPQTHPLSTTEPLKLIETYLFTQRQSIHMIDKTNQSIGSRRKACNFTVACQLPSYSNSKHNKTNKDCHYSKVNFSCFSVLGTNLHSNIIALKSNLHSDIHRLDESHFDWTYSLRNAVVA